jgi:hypothetical protein
LVGKPEEKRQLIRHGRRWKDNIRMDLREIWCEISDWIHVAQIETSADSTEHGNEP